MCIWSKAQTNLFKALHIIMGSARSSNEGVSEYGNFAHLLFFFKKKQGSYVHTLGRPCATARIYIFTASLECSERDLNPGTGWEILHFLHPVWHFFP